MKGINNFHDSLVSLSRNFLYRPVAKLMKLFLESSKKN